MRILWAIMTCLPLALSACSSDDAAKTEEPVAPASEDPAAAPAPGGAPADEAAPPPEAPGGELPADSVPPPASDTETIGELTDSSSTSVAPAPPSSLYDEPPMPSDSEIAQYDPMGREKNVSGKTVTRVVTAIKLNVRSGPSRKARVVRQLSRGDEVQAVIQGKFAKIGDGEYVRSKYLAPKGKAAKGKGKKAKAKGKGKAKKTKKKAKKAAP